ASIRIKTPRSSKPPVNNSREKEKTNSSMNIEIFAAIRVPNVVAHGRQIAHKLVSGQGGDYVYRQSLVGCTQSTVPADGSEIGSYVRGWRYVPAGSGFFSGRCIIG